MTAPVWCGTAMVRSGIGPVPVRRAKLRDRGGDAASETGGDRITFT